MINEVNILHEGHSGDLTSHSGKKSAGLLCVVSYHHEIVVELGEYSLYTLTEAFISPRRRSSVLLVQPIWDFQRDIGYVKEIQLHLGTEIAFVSEHHAVVIFPTDIFEEMEVMDACRSHVIGMDNSPYSADSVEFVSIIMQSLRSAVTPIGGSIHIVTPHGTAFRPCVLTYLDRFGINTENILSSINRHSDILTDFFGKSCRQLTPGVELSAAYQMGQVILALIAQTMKQEILTVKTKSFGCDAKCYDFEVGEFGDNAAARRVAKFIYTVSGEILADSEDSDEICYEVAHKQSNSC